jgi:trehalose 6-phosphate phosphatase
VDGTLLEIAPTPDDVVVPKGLRETLGKLHGVLGGALAVVTGRTIASVDSLFYPERWVVAGCHGAEVRMPEGAVIAHGALPTWVEEICVSLKDAAPAVLIENKIQAVSIHFRAAPHIEPLILPVLERWRQRLSEAGLALLPGKFVIDIKPAGSSKGTAFRRLMSVAPFAGRTPVFAGDDLTDQEVFSALPEFRGVGISVGRSMPGAEFQFASPSVVRRWLEDELAAGPDQTLRMEPP